MGGEPTFVSIDDMDGAEWNTAADGRKSGGWPATCLRRLGQLLRPRPLLHFGQGKWYPGESLPRWALGCYWRKDGEPIWHNPALIAADDGDYHANCRARPSAFIQHLAERLEVNAGRHRAGYEDAWYYLWKERRLPVNVDPLEVEPADEEERKRLARIFEHGLSKSSATPCPFGPFYSDPRRPAGKAAAGSCGKRTCS